MTDGKWKLEGYDTFSREDYPLPGEYDTEDAAVTAAKKHLEYLERTQRTGARGGQGDIQDQVYLVRPDGTKVRVLPD